MALFMTDLKKPLFLMVHVIKCHYLLKRDMHYFLIILLKQTKVNVSDEMA